LAEINFSRPKICGLSETFVGTGSISRLGSTFFPPQEINFHFRVSIGDCHLRSRILVETIHRQLFDSEFNVRHDYANIHREPWIPMFLHSESAANVVGILKVQNR
jgi:hypothetical protein